MKRKEKKENNSLSFIWYGNISCSHTHCGYGNEQSGDSRDRGNQVRKGSGGKPGEMYRVKEGRQGERKEGWEDGGDTEVEETEEE